MVVESRPADEDGKEGKPRPYAARQEEQTGAQQFARENQGKPDYPGLATSVSTEGMVPPVEPEDRPAD